MELRRGGPTVQSPESARKQVDDDCGETRWEVGLRSLFNPRSIVSVKNHWYAAVRRRERLVYSLVASQLSQSSFYCQLVFEGFLSTVVVVDGSHGVDT